MTVYKLGLTILAKRRIRGDLILTYRIVTGKDKVQCDSFFSYIPANSTLEDIATSRYTVYDVTNSSAKESFLIGTI